MHLQLLAEKTELADALTVAMRRPGFRPGRARGQVLADLACAILLGAVAIGDIAVLEHQREVLGPVASPPTVWRRTRSANSSSAASPGPAPRSAAGCGNS